MLKIFKYREIAQYERIEFCKRLEDFLDVYPTAVSDVLFRLNPVLIHKGRLKFQIDCSNIIEDIYKENRLIKIKEGN
jgi:hypothetical protein